MTERKPRLRVSFRDHDRSCIPSRRSVLPRLRHSRPSAPRSGALTFDKKFYPERTSRDCDGLGRPRFPPGAWGSDPQIHRLPDRLGKRVYLRWARHYAVSNDALGARLHSRVSRLPRPRSRRATRPHQRARERTRRTRVLRRFILSRGLRRVPPRVPRTRSRHARDGPSTRRRATRSSAAVRATDGDAAPAAAGGGPRSTCPRRSRWCASRRCPW